MSEVILQDFKDKIKGAWSDDDLRKLMRLAGTMSIDDLSAKLGRTVKATKQQCFMRGIKFSFKKAS